MSNPAAIFNNDISLSGDLRIYGDKKIGVGISSPPTYEIEVSGSTQSTILNATHRIGVNQSDPSYSVHINAVDAMLIPVGATGERPNDLTDGLLRYNTTDNRFEGYSSGWKSLGGVSNISGDTHIEATESDELIFYTSDASRVVIDASGQVTIEKDVSMNSSLDVSNILNVRHRFGLNQNDPSYSVHINAVDAMLIPVGESGERPNDLTDGLLRYNTTDNRFEGYANSTWKSLGGVSNISGDTRIEATESDELIFYTSDASRVVIDPSGQVTIEKDVSMNSSLDVSNILNVRHRFGVNQSDPSYSVHIDASDAMLIPVGLSSERPTGTNGLLRYNESDGIFEGYSVNGWQELLTINTTQTSRVDANDSDEIIFKTKDISRVVIDSSGHVLIKEDISINGSLEVSGQTVFMDSVTIGDPAQNYLEVSNNTTNLTIFGDLRIKDGGNIIVEDTSNTTITQLQTEVKVTDQFKVQNDGTDTALIVNQEDTTHAEIAEFQDSSSTVFKIGEGGNTTIYGTLAVHETLDISGKLDVAENSITMKKRTIFESDVSFHDTIDASDVNAQTIKTDLLTTTNGVIFNDISFTESDVSLVKNFEYVNRTVTKHESLANISALSQINTTSSEISTGGNMDVAGLLSCTNLKIGHAKLDFKDISLNELQHTPKGEESESIFFTKNIEVDNTVYAGNVISTNIIGDVVKADHIELNEIVTPNSIDDIVGRIRYYSGMYQVYTGQMWTGLSTHRTDQPPALIRGSETRQNNSIDINWTKFDEVYKDAVDGKSFPIYSFTFVDISDEYSTSGWETIRILAGNYDPVSKQPINHLTTAITYERTAKNLQNVYSSDISFDDISFVGRPDPRRSIGQTTYFSNDYTFDLRIYGVNYSGRTPNYLIIRDLSFNPTSQPGQVQILLISYSQYELSMNVSYDLDIGTTDIQELDPTDIPVDSYEISYNLLSESKRFSGSHSSTYQGIETISDNNSMNNLILPDLLPGSKYQIQIRAKNRIDESYGEYGRPMDTSFTHIPNSSYQYVDISALEPVDASMTLDLSNTSPIHCYIDNDTTFAERTIANKNSSIDISGTTEFYVNYGMQGIDISNESSSLVDVVFTKKKGGANDVVKTLSYTKDKDLIRSVNFLGVSFESTSYVDAGNDISLQDISKNKGFVYSSTFTKSPTTVSLTTISSINILPTYAWDFRNAPSGSAIYDSINNLKITPQGAITNSSGMVFNGISNYLEIDPFEFGGEFTFEMYFSADSINYSMRLFNFKSNISDFNTNFSISSSKKYSFYYEYGNYSTKMTSDANALSVDVYYHAVVTVSQTTMTYFLDGTEVLSENLSDAISLVSMDTNRIGSSESNSRYFHGTIAYFRIWKGTVLPPSDIVTLYNNRTSTTIPTFNNDFSLFTPSTNPYEVTYSIDGSNSNVGKELNDHQDLSINRTTSEFYYDDYNTTPTITDMNTAMTPSGSYLFGIPSVNTLTLTYDISVSNFASMIIPHDASGNHAIISDISGEGIYHFPASDVTDISSISPYTIGTSVTSDVSSGYISTIDTSFTVSVYYLDHSSNEAPTLSAKEETIDVSINQIFKDSITTYENNISMYAFDGISTIRSHAINPSDNDFKNTYSLDISHMLLYFDGKFVSGGYNVYNSDNPTPFQDWSDFALAGPNYFDISSTHVDNLKWIALEVPSTYIVNNNDVNLSTFRINGGDFWSHRDEFGNETSGNDIYEAYIYNDGHFGPLHTLRNIGNSPNFWYKTSVTSTIQDARDYYKTGHGQYNGALKTKTTAFLDPGRSSQTVYLVVGLRCNGTDTFTFS